MAVQVSYYSEAEVSALDISAFSLWVEDFETAMIDSCWIAFDGDRPVAFQTVNGDGLCVAIEVADEYLGQGIGSALVEESGCYRPEDNQCEEFWEKMEEIYGYQ
jgi:GNAT superfamily N-acetyltransferase